MRLINCVSGCMEEFVGTKIPRYAILSHTWEEEEVTYFEPGSWQDWPATRKGYRKIELTYHLARERGIYYIWVDTCCIDKKSSAELSEAINSMYKWYERAEVCFVYLSDLDQGSTMADLPHCKWITRGWTLQELIAPMTVLFFNWRGDLLGSKAESTTSIFQATSIAPEILLQTQSLRSVPVAEKFAWAAHRRTLRIEDIAYSLLGIFDVNIPLLYGEEHRAFRRLQEEIIRTTPDLSIFAWRSPTIPGEQSTGGQSRYSGVLADSPAVFPREQPILRRPRFGRTELSVTSIGLKTPIQLLFGAHGMAKTPSYVLPLDCGDHQGNFYGIYLRMCGPNEFVRENPELLTEYIEKMHVIGAPGKEHFLLTELPDCDCCRAIGSPSHDFSIGRLRSHALQLSMPDSMWIFGARPEGSFDYRDQLFFVVDNPEMDLAVFSITERTREFNCMFFAVGWSNTKGDSPKCTIINRDDFKQAVDDIENVLSTRSIRLSSVLRGLLDAHSIPMASSTTISARNDVVAFTISFRSSLVEDQDLCRHPMWKIEFTVDTGPLIPNDQSPRPRKPPKWQTGRASSDRLQTSHFTTVQP
ncbi:Vegetative incompatibility protein HET-E-1 [Cyphellophora attinorum]|uniref:Vegetative incompatibility protein HET-E-1 n=1 Tax=Cyphellophora attinorum TaxID=1664694 RepID=A0A0N1H3K0_9EURO|nr:Vegetative incompatibility protein HET-E-1 [Phialophora attinorum]KPI36237.1 Vegetative incompatibility protein HET-E-1 [Phialophora attinorum]